jgi:O-antigen ligase
MENLTADRRADLIHTLFCFTLSVVVFFLPIRVYYSNIAVGVAFGLWLINFKRNLPYYKPVLFVPLVIFTSVYWVHVFGLINTANLPHGFSLLEKKLALMAFPIMLLISPLNEKQIRVILLTLLGGVFVSSAICYYKSAQIIISEHLPWTSFISNELFQNFFFSIHVPIHPAYLSNLLFLSIVFIIIYFKTFSPLVKILSVILIAFYSLTILILMARASIISIFVAGLALFVFKAVETKKLSVLIAGVLIFVTLGISSFYFLPNLKNRVMDSFRNYREMVKSDDQINSVPIHAKIWHCAMNSNSGVNVLVGHGTGDERDVLKVCYETNGWHEISKYSSDSHNEYLSSFVRHGVIGVIIWIACLAYGFYAAISSKNIAYLSFLIIISLGALSESILRGQVSLLTYAFFNAIFLKLVFIRKSNGATTVA